MSATKATPYWPDRLDLCGPCQEDNGNHESCAEVDGSVWLVRRGKFVNAVCECHRAGHPTARDR